MKNNKIKLLLSLSILSTSAFSSVDKPILSPLELEGLNYTLESLNYSSTSKNLKTNAKGTVTETIGQGSEPENWFNLSSELDIVEGVQTERIYREFGEPSSKEIIVAVIDSGVDVNHEDLQGKIWINKKEIPNNGRDDDKNGYVDDVFGWNFIGNRKGMAQVVQNSNLKNGYELIKGDPALQTGADTLEVTRVYKDLLVKSEAGKLTKAEEKLYNEVKKIVLKERRSALDGYSTYTALEEKYIKSEKILKDAGLTEITLLTVRAFFPSNDDETLAKSMMLEILSRGYDLETIKENVSYFNLQANYYYNPDFTKREEIVGDNYTNTKEWRYGNNDVMGPDPSHGTHVAGIIAAVRDNNLGIKGVATNVRIMPIRVVPDGDERDKDVANGIFYAVNNGAKIINMSFGKSYSSYKEVVDRAIKYAESRGVLLIHSAGNSYQSNDVVFNYPTKKLDNGTKVNNWLEIGASGFKKGESLAASFSNYGKYSVDIFAPGVNILSTTPNNTYSTYSGTSMAAPVTSGVAALILSYMPKLKAKDLQIALINNAQTYGDLKVYKPKLGEVYFKDLSISGGIVDGYSTLKALMNP